MSGPKISVCKFARLPGLEAVPTSDDLMNIDDIFDPPFDNEVHRTLASAVPTHNRVKYTTVRPVGSTHGTVTNASRLSNASNPNAATQQQTELRTLPTLASGPPAGVSRVTPLPAANPSFLGNTGGRDFVNIIKSGASHLSGGRFHNTDPMRCVPPSVAATGVRPAAHAMTRTLTPSPVVSRAASSPIVPRNSTPMTARAPNFCPVRAPRPQFRSIMAKPDALPKPCTDISLESLNEPSTKDCVLPTRLIITNPRPQPDTVQLIDHQRLSQLPNSLVQYPANAVSAHPPAPYSMGSHSVAVPQRSMQQVRPQGTAAVLQQRVDHLSATIDAVATDQIGARQSHQDRPVYAVNTVNPIITNSTYSVVPTSLSLYPSMNYTYASSGTPIFVQSPPTATIAIGTPCVSSQTTLTAVDKSPSTKLTEPERLVNSIRNEYAKVLNAPQSQMDQRTQSISDVLKFAPAPSSMSLKEPELPSLPVIRATTSLAPQQPAAGRTSILAAKVPWDAHLRQACLPADQFYMKKKKPPRRAPCPASKREPSAISYPSLLSKMCPCTVDVERLSARAIDAIQKMSAQASTSNGANADDKEGVYILPISDSSDSDDNVRSTSGEVPNAGDIIRPSPLPRVSSPKSMGVSSMNASQSVVLNSSLPSRLVANAQEPHSNIINQNKNHSRPIQSVPAIQKNPSPLPVSKEEVDSDADTVIIIDDNHRLVDNFIRDSPLSPDHVFSRRSSGVTPSIHPTNAHTNLAAPLTVDLESTRNNNQNGSAAADNSALQRLCQPLSSKLLTNVAKSNFADSRANTSHSGHNHLLGSNNQHSLKTSQFESRPSNSLSPAINVNKVGRTKSELLDKTDNLVGDSSPRIENKKENHTLRGADDRMEEITYTPVVQIIVNDSENRKSASSRTEVSEILQPHLLNSTKNLDIRCPKCAKAYPLTHVWINAKSKHVICEKCVKCSQTSLKSPSRNLKAIIKDISRLSKELISSDSEGEEDFDERVKHVQKMARKVVKLNESKPKNSSPFQTDDSEDEKNRKLAWKNVESVVKQNEKEKTRKKEEIEKDKIRKRAGLILNNSVKDKKIRQKDDACIEKEVNETKEAEREKKRKRTENNGDYVAKKIGKEVSKRRESDSMQRMSIEDDESKKPRSRLNLETGEKSQTDQVDAPRMTSIPKRRNIRRLFSSESGDD